MHLNTYYVTYLTMTKNCVRCIWGSENGFRKNKRTGQETKLCIKCLDTIKKNDIAYYPRRLELQRERRRLAKEQKASQSVALEHQA